MSFVSFVFLAFLALSFFVYYIVPKRFQWIALLVFSYLYYYLSSHKLIVVLFVVSLFTWFMGIVIDKNDDKKKRKLYTRIAIIAVLFILIVFKYLNFIIFNINELFGLNISLLKLMLPLGISYFTLQAIAYLYDIGHKKYAVEKNLFHFLLYMAYFPQILQGPIPHFDKLNEQFFEGHEFDFERITKGLQLFGWGLAKKIILADRLGTAVTYIFDHYEEYHGVFLYFGVFLYSFQIYADFAGGIDAIRGISEVFGIELEQNFRQPYFSRSIEEFWRRWHISLGAWMRDYVFYPVSLSKRLNKIGKSIRKFNNDLGKKFAALSANFIVYLLVGIWHDASWIFVVYGLWNALFTMSGVLFADFYKKCRNKLGIKEDSPVFVFFQMTRTFTIVTLLRFFCRAKTVHDAYRMIGLMFVRFFDLSYFNAETLTSLGINMREWILCLIVSIVILFADYLNEKGIVVRDAIAKKNIVIRWALYIILILAILVFGKYGPGYEASNFIYGSF